MPIIVADEPTGNLDEDTEAKILQIFKKLAENGKIVIVVTHSQKVAAHAHAMVYRMKNGILKRNNKQLLDQYVTIRKLVSQPTQSG